MATDGTLALVADPPFFRVIDVSTTSAPRELSSLRIDGIGDRVRVSGGQAILFGRGEVQLIDVSNPYSPRLMSVFHALGGPPSTAAFARYDLSDPRNPVETSFTSTQSVNVIAADADTLYLATSGSVQTMNMTNPARPALSATSIQPKSPLQLAAAKGKLVIADRYSLRVYGPNTAPPPPPPPARRRSAGH